MSDIKEEEEYAKKYPDLLRLGRMPSKKDQGFVKVEDRFVEIVSRLFLASAAQAQNEMTMDENKITHVLHIGVRKIQYRKPRTQHVVFMEDEDVDISAVLKEAIEFIQRSLRASETNKICVHCFAGSSRSPTVVAAYLASSQSVDTDQAFSFVLQKAPWICPSGFFQTQVRNYLLFIYFFSLLLNHVHSGGGNQRSIDTVFR